MRILISDFHAGCQLWQHAILESIGNEVFINSFSGHSHLIENKKKISVTPEAQARCNIHNIEPILNSNEVERVISYDTVLVSFPPKFIDLYKNVKFKYPKLLNVGHRLHILTKHDAGFIDSLTAQVKNNEIIICSMSVYDTEYIKHYMGVTPLELYVTCFHIPQTISYSPTRSEILISPVHATSVLPFSSISEMNRIASQKGYNLHFSGIKTLYGNYKYENLVQHKATVLFPYSVFSISMIEMYEMNIPMFVPSKRLLMETNIMNDVSIFPCYGSEEDMKRIDIPHKDSPHTYSPNSTKPEDKLYWLSFTYFNTKENVIFWDSQDDLFDKLVTTDLQEVSNRMKKENTEHREKQLKNWKHMLEMVNQRQPFAQYG